MQDFEVLTFMALLPVCAVVAIARFLAMFCPTLRMPAKELSQSFDESFGDKSYVSKARHDPLVIFDSPRLRTAA